jgi:hypothetical protein
MDLKVALKKLKLAKIEEEETTMKEFFAEADVLL